MKQKIIWVLAILTTLSLLGCGINIGVLKDYNNLPVQRSDAKTLTLADVDRAIHAAAAYKGWSSKTEAAGHIVAEIKHPGEGKENYGASVDILFTDHDYSIHYKSSYGLSYNGTKGTIHKHYGLWVSNLEESINSSLQLITPGN